MAGDLTETNSLCFMLYVFLVCLDIAISQGREGRP